AFQASLGYEQRITEDIGVSATAYWSEQRDLLGFGADGAFGNTGAGFSRGIEALVRHDPGKAGFFGWVSYTLQQAERVDDFASACPRSGDGGDADCSPWYRFDYDQTHILTVVASYKFPRGWQFGARFRLISGNPTTPTRNGVYDAQLGGYIGIDGPLNGDRLPAFHQLDLRIDKQWVRKRTTVTAYLDVQNVYDHRYPEIWVYSLDWSQRSALIGLPIYPSLGLQVDF
ncbi:MAG: energy transducer TonB, partial [Myxococcales bacterium]|nr:energy transducer TonB [Myxococcales bacterium]